MTIQSSGALALTEIQTEFGGINPVSMSEYYRGGSYVANDSSNTNIPGSGAIAFSNFYGTSKPSGISQSLISVGNYFAASAYSLDRVDGSVWLTVAAMGGRPEINQQAPNSDLRAVWLQYRARGADNTAGYNGNADGQKYRYDTYQTYTRFHWWQSIDVVALGVGTNTDVGASSGGEGGFYAQGNVAYTYRITKLSSNSVELRTYTGAWNTGDTGNNITISNWWNGFNNATGNNTEANGYLGWFTLTW